MQVLINGQPSGGALGTLRWFKFLLAKRDYQQNWATSPLASNPPESAPLIAVVEVTKAYLALVLGTISEQGEINAKLRSFQTVDRYRAVVHPYGKEALTLFQRLAVLPGVT